MTATTPARERVLFVGAYERDNFGDLLFLLVSEQYLTEAGFDVVAAAPLAADMTELLDRQVEAFVPLLESESYDQVWTVGGEVGGTRVQTALWMSVSGRLWRRYRAGGARVRAAMRRDIIGTTDIESPYMPRLSQFPLNSGTPTVLNSVGLAGIDGRDVGDRERLVRILREATVVSVRDQLSSDLLSRHGVDHVLVPDVVHTIRYTHPRPEGETRGGAVLVQAARRMLASVGIEAFAQALVTSEALAPHPIRLFAAGLAPNHDSLEDYEQIVDAVHRHDPDRDIAILDVSRRPWDLVDEIRRAHLWIGGSLHGRIVASAYDVPRISFPKRKLDTYARTWDPHMPYGSTPESLDEDVRRALGAEARALASGTGERLAQLADQSIRSAITAASQEALAETTARRFAAAQQAIVERDRRARRTSARLRKQVAELSSPSRAAALRSRGRSLAGAVRRRARRLLGRA